MKNTAIKIPKAATTTPLHVNKILYISLIHTGLLLSSDCILTDAKFNTFNDIFLLPTGFIAAPNGIPAARKTTRSNVNITNIIVTSETTSLPYP